MEIKTFAVIGQDGRQQAAAEELACRGYRVCGEEGIGGADFVLLPMPLSIEKGPLAAILGRMRPGAVAFAGRVGREAAETAAHTGTELVDYLLREELAVLNAIPTCEGALEILLRERQVTLWQSKVIITGFGRIGKLLALRLRALGAQVTVAARKPGDRALAEGMGLAAVDTAALGAVCAGADILVNTVPQRIITAEQIGKMGKQTFLLDLASAPGGIDLSAAGAAGLRSVWALSLPARTAPVTAGRFVADTVLRMIAERGQ